MLRALPKSEFTIIETAGRQVRLSNPGKIYFPEIGLTKLELVEYYLTVADACLAHLHNRPTVLKRFVNGASGEAFFQKRVPDSAPDWLSTTEIRFPGGRTARELLPNDSAHLVWGVNLGTIDWNPWQVRAPDVDHPDELRVDLDPTPEAAFPDVRRAALVVREALESYGLTGYPKTSGSRGIHINVPIVAEHEFIVVRRAGVALAREVQRRAPDLVTTAWWKEERHGVFIDYNQNARDRTVASAWSVRPVPDARVSTPVEWSEVEDVEPAELTVRTIPERLATKGDPTADMEANRASLARLLTQADEDEAAGLPDLPWPPNFRKMPGEAKRVQPSRARKDESV